MSLFKDFVFSDSDFNPFDVSCDISSVCNESDSKGIYRLHTCPIKLMTKSTVSQLFSSDIMTVC